MTINRSGSLHVNPATASEEENLVSKPKTCNGTTTVEKAVVENKARILSDLVPFLLCRTTSASGVATKRCSNNDDSVMISSSGPKKRVEYKKEYNVSALHEGNKNISSGDGQAAKKRKRHGPDDTDKEESWSPAATNGENGIWIGADARLSSNPTTAMSHHRTHLKKLLDENRLLETKRRQLRDGHKSLIHAYEFGLRQVSKLNDLTLVPDNIMEGNFPKNEV